MAIHIRRRELITALGSAAAWPLAGRAQQPERMRRIGLLMLADDREGQARARALKQGLQELGWTEGRNIQIETRFAGADVGHMRADAAELVALAPDVIVGNTTPVVRALRQATSSIPIIMAAVPDPVGLGIVRSTATPVQRCKPKGFARFSGYMRRTDRRRLEGRCRSLEAKAQPEHKISSRLSDNALIPAGNYGMRGGMPWR